MSERSGGPPTDPRAEPPAASPTDPLWPKVLALSAHEIRQPLTVISGCVRMLLQERAGPLNDHQRELLQKADRSCARLSQVLAELSELSRLESDAPALTRRPVSLHAILTAAIEALPALPDHPVTVALAPDSAALVNGDAGRLQVAFSAILHALRRELVTSDALEVQTEASDDGAPSVCIAIGERARMPQLLRPDPAARLTFDEWRGGNGLGLPNARRIIEAHGGQLWSVAGASTAESKTTAIVRLPAIR